MMRTAAGMEAGDVVGEAYGSLGAATVPDLSTFADLAEAGMHIGCRRIVEGDEYALLPSELPSFRNAVTKVRRQSGAARLVARALLPRLGRAPTPILKSAVGGPIWPEGVVGSLAHDATFALAAVARKADFICLGIDIEPDQPLPDDLSLLVSTPRERRRYDPTVLSSRLLFAAKEAVYKALHPIDGIFLDFQDIEIDLSGQVANVSTGRQVALRTLRSGHIVALAWASFGRL